MATQSDNLIYDGILAIPGGMDSGTLPRLLQFGKAAFGFNLTFRGGFPTDRPKFRKIELTFDSADIQAAVETGLFQGADFYRFQSGIGSVVASIAGRLFQFVPDTTGGATVSERTIPGDPNLATQPQSWGWQSELWEIITDGNKLPIFMDDNTARRSGGPSVDLGSVATAFTVPAVDSNVTVTLASNYTAALNTLVTIDSTTHLGNYIVISVGAPGVGTGYEASVKNINAVAGTSLAVGTPVIFPGVTNVIGTTVAPFNVPNGVNDNGTVVVQFSVSVGNQFPNVTIAGRRYRVSAIVDIALHKYRLGCFDLNTSGATVTVPTGTTIYYTDITPQPSYTVGTLVVAATAPAVNASISVFLDTLYTGVSNLAVTINGKNYQISPVAQAPPVPSTTIVLKNLTDNPGTTVPVGKLLITIGELGIGRMGDYGHARNWMSLIDGISFTASDLVGESSGSSAYNFRDAVLKVSKNEALTAGKPFRVPTTGDTIQGMSFPAQLDASLGQGPLSVLTNSNGFSCLAPTDSAQWATLTTPILPQSLSGSGTTSHWSLAQSNCDLFFRSPDGIRSQLIARLDFNKWGSTPISYEMTRVISLDEPSLLNFCSAVVFGNRLLMTSGPVQGPTGVYHQGLIVANFDELSSLQDKSPAVYDGLWTGLQILKLIKSPLKGFSGATRQFALCYSSVSGKNEFWEILPDGALIADQVSADPICTGHEFEELTNLVPSTDNLTLWLDAGTNWTAAVWTGRQFATPFNSNGIGVGVIAEPNLLNLTSDVNGQRTYSGTATNTSTIFLEYSRLSNLNEGIVLTIGGAAVFKVEFLTAGSTIKVTTGGVNSISVAGIANRPTEYIIQVTTDPVGGTILTIYKTLDLTVLGTASMVSGVDLTGANAVVFSNTGNGGTFGMYTRGLLGYSAVPTGQSFTDTLNYLRSLLFGRFNVPVACSSAEVRTIWGFESPDLFRGQNNELVTQFKALEGGEISVDDVQGDVDFQVFYKSDQYPGWVPWHNWSISVDMSKPNAQPGYFPRMGLGRPKSTADNDVTGQLSRFGYTFQTRMVIQGHCRVLSSKYAASLQPQPKIKTPIDGSEHRGIAIPPLDDYAVYNINGGITALPP